MKTVRDVVHDPVATPVTDDPHAGTRERVARSILENGPSTAAALGALLVGAGAARAETVTIATVNNGDMIVMQKLSSAFEEQHPDIELEWVVLEENVLRQRVTTDIATEGGQFDVMTIGTYEVPIWAKNGWLHPMCPVRRATPYVCPWYGMAGTMS